MLLNKRVGVGIVTYNRRPGLLKLVQSLPREIIDALIIVNDGERYAELDALDCVVHHNEENQGVGRSKNTALRYLQQQQVDHFFLIEDDIYIKHPDVFLRYIELSLKTGIQHFNFSQHGPNNHHADGSPLARLHIEYDDFTLPLYPICVGAFCYYSAQCLQTVGLFDEHYHNTTEHLDHTFAIIRVGMHPDWHYFPDIVDSHHYLGDEGWSLHQSTNTRNPTWRARVLVAAQHFCGKYGSLPKDIPLQDADVIRQQLRTIRKNFAAQPA